MRRVNSDKDLKNQGKGPLGRKLKYIVFLLDIVVNFYYN